LQVKLPALLELARQGNPRDQLAVLDSLSDLDFSGLSEEGLLIVLRIYERLLGRNNPDLKALVEDHRSRLRILLPHSSSRVNRELSRILCFLNDTAVIEPLLLLMQQDQGEKDIVGTSLVERNLRYGAPMLAMMQAAPLIERMHHAQMLLWLKKGWSLDQRRRYFELIVDAIQTSKGGNGYETFWKQILDLARNDLSPEELERFSTIWAPLDQVQPLPEPEGPGRLWELDYLMSRIEKGIQGRDFENGKMMYAAATCSTCHVMGNKGGLVGPNLTSVGQRFTVHDLLESIIYPSKAISDQYQMTTFTLRSGEVVSGRVYSKDSNKTVVAPNITKPSELRSIPNDQITSVSQLPVSTMPPNLLIRLNEDEVLDLVAYLMAGGQPEHGVFK
ncbi:MAG: c-type cytochrome, partial [Verrucomicrobiae bacterium]|nr:c-type cytochrome [Verrucomicrobiae bacterium]